MGDRKLSARGERPESYVFRSPAYNPDNFRHRTDNFFGVAEESALLFIPSERAAPVLPPAPPTCRHVGSLDELAVALGTTPRFGDDSAIDRDPRALRLECQRLEQRNAALAWEARAARAGRLVEDAVGAVLRTATRVLGELRAPVPPPQCTATYEILIPIYNAYEHVQRCVASVLRHTNPRHPVVLLDDASTDPRILPTLREFGRIDARVQVVAADANVGFVGNVNRGFARSRRDVVILNSDTEVTPDWLERMDRCRHSHPAIGVVSPLSNNATILSVPSFNAANELPEGMSPERFAALVASVSPRSYPRLPTAVGFCMLITRATLDRVGAFDRAFGLGYGEESDLCMRAWQAGDETACCDDAYVHHYGEASFSAVEQIGKRRLENARTLSRRWPQYHPTVERFCHLNPLRTVQERITTTLRGPDRRPHVLHVVHSFWVPGGTELHTRQMVDGTANAFRSTVLYPGQLSGDWLDMKVEEQSEHLRVVALRKENAAAEDRFLGVAGSIGDETMEVAFARFLAGGDYDIVHFQHLAHWASLRFAAHRQGHGQARGALPARLFPVVPGVQPDHARVPPLRQGARRRRR